VTNTGLADLRSHPYEAYASQHAGCDLVLTRSPPSVAHGLASAVQVMVRQVVRGSGLRPPSVGESLGLVLL
jgi:hypothetical protein